MASIYNIDNWTNSENGAYTSFEVNDIVKHGNFYWYCTKSHTNSTTTYTPSKGSIYWDGVIYSTKLGTDEPYFLWSPSYGGTTQHNPRIQAIKYGDGYEQRLKDGINTDLLKLELTFENRTEKEATAIVHFLDAKEAVETFYYKVHPPYSMVKKFICKSWSSNFTFKDTYTVTASLEEVS